MKNYYEELPENYEQVYVVDAKNKKFGVILNLISLVITAGILAVIFITAEMSISELKAWLLLIFVAIYLVYIVLHELVHGLVYKLMTKHKLTFGFTASVAYCGVPDLYVSKKTALFALCAPLLLFAAILIPVLVVVKSVDVTAYMGVGFLTAMHFGGCTGDMFDIILLLTKLRDKKLLMNDSGPTQKFYLPKKPE